MGERSQAAWLELENGMRLRGTAFGAAGATSGEVVFTTSMVGYVESLTDPSYRGQILVMTYPLIGNYGVPDPATGDRFESERIQVSGLVVSSLEDEHSHPQAAVSLSEWLRRDGVPGITGIDTRHLTLNLRERGTMLGRVLLEGTDRSNEGPMFDPNRADIVSDVSIPSPQLFGEGAGKRVVLVDCGAKRSIRLELLARGLEVLQVPHDYDYTGERFDGVVISNGPGNPKHCAATIETLRRAMSLGQPIFGICLGSQLLALASGARTYKLRYGHRGQNQPCKEEGTRRCRLTSQNHGFAIDGSSLPQDWKVWFSNANDGSVEGIRHARRPFMAVQFHPEASPGPLDTSYLFDTFAEQL